MIYFPDLQPLSYKKLTAIFRDDNRDALEVELAVRGNRITDFILRPTDAPSSKTIYHLALDKLAVNCFEFLVSRAINPYQFNVPDENGDTILHKIVSIGSRGNSDQLLRCLDMLINAGADINVRDSNMDTPMHILIARSKTKEEALDSYVDTVLKSENLDLNARNYNDEVSITNAPKNIYEKLKEYRDTNKETIIVKLIRDLYESLMFSSKIELEKAFRNARKYPNIELKYRFIGTKSLLFHLVEILELDDISDALRFGSDPWIRNTNDNKLPLEAALSRGNLPVVHLLLQTMKKRQNISNKIDIVKHSSSLLRSLICNYSSIENQTRVYNRLGCLKRLLEPDVIIDVNKSNEKNAQMTPLDMAISMKWNDAISLLSDSGVKKSLLRSKRECK